MKLLHIAELLIMLGGAFLAGVGYEQRRDAGKWRQNLQDLDRINEQIEQVRATQAATDARIEVTKKMLAGCK
jgi:hypothetical protein